MAGSHQSGSEPDLRDLSKQFEENKANTSRRTFKRKNMDDALTSDLTSLFSKFTDEITVKICNWKTELETKISGMQEDIKSAIKSDLDNIKTDIKHIDTRQSQLFADLSVVKESLCFYDKEQDDLKKRVNELSTVSKSNNSENSAMRQQIDNLHSELNTLQQRERKQNLEIMGVPEKTNEDLCNYLINIAKHAEIQLSSQDVEFITRVQPYTKVPGRPKTIIAKLKSNSLRDCILSGIRKKKGITTQDIGISGDIIKIFVNEHLTPSNKLLFKNTREKAASAHYLKPWVRDGKIFVRKNDTSQSFCIRDHSYLKKIV